MFLFQCLRKADTNDTKKRHSSSGSRAQSVSTHDSDTDSGEPTLSDSQRRAHEIVQRLEDEATEPSGGSRLRPLHPAHANHAYPDTVLTHDYIRRVLGLLRDTRSKIEAQGKRLSKDDITPELSRESAQAPTVSLAVADTVLYSLLQEPTLRTSPRKVSLGSLSRMSNGELLVWSEQLVQSLTATA